MTRVFESCYLLWSEKRLKERLYHQLRMQIGSRPRKRLHRVWDTYYSIAQ